MVFPGLGVTEQDWGSCVAVYGVAGRRGGVPAMFEFESEMGW